MRLTCFAVLGVALGAPLAAQSRDEGALERVTKRAIERVAVGVVEIEALGGLEEAFQAPTNEAGAEEGILARKGFKQAYGPSTGLVVREDGWILTSTFFLRRKPRHLIVTTHDGKSYLATLAGQDEARALCLLKVQAKGLTPVTWAAPEALRVGRYAIALGRGLGYEHLAVSRGIVSGLNRIGGRALQSSAAISPMNYGGPLVSLEGEVLGILVPLSMQGGQASVEIYDSGIGFAIPAVDAVAAIPRLSKAGVLRPGFLGVVPDPLSQDGVRIAQVSPGSPAAQAGLEPGDTITAVGERAVERAWQLRHALGAHYAGDEVELSVSRGTERKTLTLTLGAPPGAGK
ncbi:MAG: PDZ domain-containing protein [Planctomycetes bacterium]|nr:PDZ domain-containing protein [Planctomycetota bacterium]